MFIGEQYGSEFPYKKKPCHAHARFGREKPEHMNICGKCRTCGHLFRADSKMFTATSRNGQKIYEPGIFLAIHGGVFQRGGTTIGAFTF